ncbi:ribosome biogenesis GTP-binding protein YihA/YsxC [Helicobacter kayseriensis]|uniref:ribosome biogenesis GTP-binding protein YihA/YsxC n=1 Tax=Helicobacter kayseriensis TaxID=2905877 RepID=UPI001E2A58B4|nr:ribosome biogenesis GTP-binding protein YihA/YsxC [Helicobacter kayseriensis]MCE3046721.1 ribosome biogenesis GTP-binding protein YihA/YsxC [Helicobacter kayseriensis]MCE3047977.1 ribosome biogenesis GTP-binding protein YihA/YsxC [Helicobacter kayseriensis]
MIKDASFLTSASHFSQCPEPQSVEIACLGRSNVGKSSFINWFLRKQGLAKSSSTPGKTRLINFYQASFCGDEAPIMFRIIDLPGFGYAKVSKEQKRIWEKNLLEFLEKRRSIKLFLHLIDSRHPNLPIDQEVQQFLKTLCKGDQKFLKLYTKADKLKNQEKMAFIAKKENLISTFANESKITPLNFLQEQIIKIALGQKSEI